MRVSLNKLFEKTEEVYIVNFKYTNAAIESSGVDYAMCNVGIHPDGIISVMSRGNKFVIRKRSDTNIIHKICRYPPLPHLTRTEE